jgi:hypothetical protein
MLVVPDVQQVRCNILSSDAYSKRPGPDGPGL